MAVILIADSGATKAEWCLLNGGRRKTIFTQGLNPYFLSTDEIAAIIENELLKKTGTIAVEEIHFYGSGCGHRDNVKSIRKALKKVFPGAKSYIETDLMAAARAACGKKKGIVSILGTGSNSGYYNGRRIVKNSPGLGYILGDEGSGAYLGKKVLQYYLYKTYDEELQSRFEAEYPTTAEEIIHTVYRKPMANRYLAAFTLFLAQNRGHYMIENIIEDGINDFFFQHLCKYAEVWKLPVHFIGSVAAGFKDVLKELCQSYEFEFGSASKSPMPGLITYHNSLQQGIL